MATKLSLKLEDVRNAIIENNLSDFAADECADVVEKAIEVIKEFEKAAATLSHLALVTETKLPSVEADLLAALKLARAYLDVSLGSPSWKGENPYPIIDAALARAEGK